MSRILYRAKSARGADVADYVEAASAVEARDKLAAAGMTDIVLLQSPDIAALSNAPLPGLTQKQQARLRADLMEKPGLATALRGMIRINRVGLFVVFVLLVLGVWRQNLPLLAIAATLLLLPFGIFFWKRRHLDRYQRLMKAYARGQWDEVRKLAPLLRSATTSKLLSFDLDVRLACIEAREGRLASAVQGMQHWKNALANAPGIYEARLASVHNAARDYAGYLDLMEQAAELGKQDPSRLIDVALAHVKFGNAARAQAILDGLDVTLLPPLAPKFIVFAYGLLRLRAGEPDDALPHLRTATEGFLESSLQSPAAWTALAICSGYHAVTLARSGRPDAARQMIADVLPIINVHGEQPLLDMLQHEVLNIAA